MHHFHHKKIFAAVLSCCLAAAPVQTDGNSFGNPYVQAAESFADIHELYSYWCENHYANYPKNVGGVYCYYDNSQDIVVEAETPAYDPGMPDYDPEPDCEVPAEIPPVEVVSAPAVISAAGTEITTVETAQPQEKAAVMEDTEPALAEAVPIEAEICIDTAAEELPVENAAVTVSNKEVITVSSTEDAAGNDGFFVGAPAIEPEDPMDELDYDLVVGLVSHTQEAEQEILSQLQDKAHVAFTDCNYSQKEILRVHEEISAMMMEKDGKASELGIIGSGITCSVERKGDAYSPMKNYVDVSVLPGYEETADMLKERYGDKVEVFACEIAVTEDLAVEDAMTEGISEDDKQNSPDIGGEFPAAAGIGAAQTDGFSCTITALCKNNTFTFQGSWKKAVWTVEPASSVKILSKNNHGKKLKIKAKKTGTITITSALGKKNNQQVFSQQVLIFDKNGTVKNQKELEAALCSAKVKKITIQTDKKKQFVLPEGNYEKKTLIVKAPKSTLEICDADAEKYITIKKIAKLSKEYVSYSEEKDSSEQKTENPVSSCQDEKTAEEEPADDLFSGNAFSGTILELGNNGKMALVEPDEGMAIRSSGDRVRVNLTMNTTDKFLAGDRVIVYYDGMVMESYPLQIRTVNVEKVEDVLICW